MPGERRISCVRFTCCGIIDGTLGSRELRRREKLGTVWTEHNLLALLQKQGLLNQTT